jgi:hypothetical protein
MLTVKEHKEEERTLRTFQIEDGTIVIVERTVTGEQHGALRKRRIWREERVGLTLEELRKIVAKFEKKELRATIAAVL